MNIKHKAIILHSIVHCLFIDFFCILLKLNGGLREMMYMKTSIVIELYGN